MLAMAIKHNKIGELLEIKGWSIYKLAKEVGMSYQALHALVNSTQIPDGTAYGTLKKISEALGVGIDDLEKTEEER